MMLTTGISMLGKMSVGVRTIASVPRRRITIVSTTMVCGCFSASLTIHMIHVLTLFVRPGRSVSFPWEPRLAAAACSLCLAPEDRLAIRYVSHTAFRSRSGFPAGLFWRGGCPFSRPLGDPGRVFGRDERHRLAERLSAPHFFKASFILPRRVIERYSSRAWRSMWPKLSQAWPTVGSDRTVRKCAGSASQHIRERAFIGPGFMRLSPGVGLVR